MKTKLSSLVGRCCCAAISAVALSAFSQTNPPLLVDLTTMHTNGGTITKGDSLPLAFGKINTNASKFAAQIGSNIADIAMLKTNVSGGGAGGTWTNDYLRKSFGAGNDLTMTNTFNLIGTNTIGWSLASVTVCGYSNALLNGDYTNNGGGLLVNGSGFILEPTDPTTPTNLIQCLYAVISGPTGDGDLYIDGVYVWYNSTQLKRTANGSNNFAYILNSFTNDATYGYGFDLYTHCVNPYSLTGLPSLNYQQLIGHGPYTMQTGTSYGAAGAPYPIITFGWTNIPITYTPPMTNFFSENPIFLSNSIPSYIIFQSNAPNDYTIVQTDGGNPWQWAAAYTNTATFCGGLRPGQGVFFTVLPNSWGAPSADSISCWGTIHGNITNIPPCGCGTFGKYLSSL